MDCIQIEYVRTDNAGKEWYKVIITSPTVPDNLEFDGSSVDHMPNGTGIAAGSVLLTPSANYVAYVDGTFGGGGLNGDGIKALSITGVDLDPAPSSLVPLLVPEGSFENMISATFEASEAISGKALTFVITPTSNWVPYLDDGGEVYEVGNAGEPLTVTYTPVSNSVTDIVLAAVDDPDADEPRVASITATIRYGMV